VTLARAWLQDNLPCTMQDYILNVAPVMPVHIIRSGKRAKQVALARGALKRLCVAECEDGMLTMRSGISAKKYDHLAKLAACVNEHGVICLPRSGRCKDKELDAFRTWIRSHGAKSKGRGRYELSDKLKDMLPDCVSFGRNLRAEADAKQH